MKLLRDSLAHAMHLATAARTRLLIVGQVILDALTRQVRRQRPAAALLSRSVFDGWHARVRAIAERKNRRSKWIERHRLLDQDRKAVDPARKSIGSRCR